MKITNCDIPAAAKNKPDRVRWVVTSFDTADGDAASDVYDSAPSAEELAGVAPYRVVSIVKVEY